MWLYNGDLSYRQCNKLTETAGHILYKCKALDHRREAIYGNQNQVQKNVANIQQANCSSWGWNERHEDLEEMDKLDGYQAKKKYFQ